jgi:cholesterol oxidase
VTIRALHEVREIIHQPDGAYTLVVHEIDERVGQGWGTNGNVMLGRANLLWDTTGSLQSGMPALGIDNWADPVHPAFAEIAPVPAVDRRREGVVRQDQPGEPDDLPGRPVRRHPPVENRFTYHPLGGLVLGEATDGYGRVKGYRNLYVTDGSLIPGSTGVNPFVTITALAERNIERVLAEDLKG